MSNPRKKTKSAVNKNPSHDVQEALITLVQTARNENVRFVCCGLLGIFEGYWDGDVVLKLEKLIEAEYPEQNA